MARSHPPGQTHRQAGREQIQLPSTGAVAGLGGALGAFWGISGSTPRQPTGRPLTASFTERNTTTYINCRQETPCNNTGINKVLSSFRSKTKHTIHVTMSH